MEDFSSGLSSHWRRYTKGGGAVDLASSSVRLVTEGATADRYSDAQIDDYHHLSRRRFLWHPPLKLTVRARFSHPAADNTEAGEASPRTELRGTAGFGFWNDPLLMTGTRLPALPRAIWFFYGSPPSNIKLDIAVPGTGWKAATIDALRPISVVLAPLAPAAVLLMNIPAAGLIGYPSPGSAGNETVGALCPLGDHPGPAGFCMLKETGIEQPGLLSAKTHLHLDPRLL